MTRTRPASRLLLAPVLLFCGATMTMASQTYVLRSHSAEPHSPVGLQQSIIPESSHGVASARTAARPWIIADRYAINDPDDPSNLSPVASRDVSQSKTHNQAVRIASNYRGTRYVWGGTTSRGFDCSGFVRYVYAKLGHHLPRTAREQFHVGTPVSYSELRPGDMLFFHTSRRGISHVGIYVGNNRFIHAANPRKGVVETELSGYYAHRLVGARRVS